MGSGLEQRKNYAPPSQGLNSRYSPIVLNDLEANTLTNYQVNANGILEKYPGYIKDALAFPNDVDSFIRSMYNFKRGSSIDYLLVAALDEGNTNTNYEVDIKYTIGDGNYAYIVHNIGTASFTTANTTVTGTSTQWTTELKAGDKIKVASHADTAYTEIASIGSNTSITLVGGGYLGASSGGAVAYSARKILNKSAIPRFTTFNNFAIIVNGVDEPQSYDGSSLNDITHTYSGTVLTSSGSTPPKVSYIISHKNRLFGARTTSFPSDLFWSAVSDQTTWDANSSEHIYPQDGGSIVSIVSFSDSVIVFKNNGRIYQVVGNFDDSDVGTVADIRRLNVQDNIGVIAEQSTIVHNNHLYFMAETGLYRIDPRLFIEKVSYNIDPTVQDFNFSYSGTASKSYIYDTKTQWDSGTHTGTYSNTDGILRTFFDDFRQTDAHVNYNQCAITIGTDNIIHTAYVTKANTGKINYVKYAVDGTATKEDIGVTETAEISSVSIAVSSVDQTVGIAYTNRNSGSKLYYVERTPGSSGTWGAKEDVGATPVADGAAMAQLIYTSGGTPYIAWTGLATNNFLGFSSKSGSWSSIQITSGSGSGVTEVRCTIAVDNSGNIYVAYTHGGGSRIDAYKSTTSGATWTTIETFSLPSNLKLESNMCSFLDHSNNFYTAYTNSSNQIIKRNHTSGSSATFDSTSNSMLRGFLSVVDYTGSAEKYYCLNNVGVSGSQAEKYFYETSSSLTNPTTNVISKAVGARPGSSPMVNNSQVIASIGYGTSANELVIRRMTFSGNWLGPEASDSSLSAWGTYDVSGELDNGATVTHKVALASSSPASSFATIVSGAVISSNITLVFVKPKVVFVIGGWSGMEIDSIILNYTGAGVDAKQVVGVEYLNELFFAGAVSGQTANNECLVLDIKDAPLIVEYPVTCFARFKNKLYAGSSTNGNVYILKQGYGFNGVAYTADFISKEDFMGSIELEKSVSKLFMLYQVKSAGSLTFSYRLDNFKTPAGATWNDVTVDQTEDGIYELQIGDKARSIQFRVKNTGLDNQVGIFGFVLVYGNLNVRV